VNAALADAPKLVRTTKGFALVDADCYEYLAQFRWYIEAGYAVRDRLKIEEHLGLPGVIKMHRLILGAPPPGVMVDHINRDRLDNRRANLRFATPTQNAQNANTRCNNKLGLPGIQAASDRPGWRARIVVGRRKIHLGYFDKLVDAVRARRAAEFHHFRDFAPRNSALDEFLYEHAIEFARCPACHRAEEIIADGMQWTGVCSGCGWCAHPAITGDTCDQCGRRYELDGRSARHLVLLAVGHPSLHQPGARDVGLRVGAPPHAAPGRRAACVAAVRLPAGACSASAWDAGSPMSACALLVGVGGRGGSRPNQGCASRACCNPDCPTMTSSYDVESA
jgi:hypothetical protein